MIATLLVIVVAFAHQTQGAPSNSSKCYKHEGYFYPYFSTRTTYNSVRGKITRFYPTCSTVQIWMLTRHEARYPDEVIIMKMLSVVKIKNRIIQSYESGAGYLCNSEVDELQSWQLDSNFNAKSAQLLTSEGKQNLRSLAQRLRNNFAELFDATESSEPTDFIFRATNTQRTQDSLKAFARGLFGVDNYTDYFVPPALEQNDALLMAHKLCPAWLESYFRDNVNAELDKFSEGSEIKAIIDGISKRFGFAVDLDVVNNMYDMCRYETSWHQRQPLTWCRLVHE